MKNKRARRTLTIVGGTLVAFFSNRYYTYAMGQDAAWKQATLLVLAVVLLTLIVYYILDEDGAW